jgi:hypothetical protein
MLSVVLLSVAFTVMLSVIMLNVVMLNVIMLSVVVPTFSIVLSIMSKNKKTLKETPCWRFVVASYVIRSYLTLCCNYRVSAVDDTQVYTLIGYS